MRRMHHTLKNLSREALARGMSCALFLAAAACFISPSAHSAEKQQQRNFYEVLQDLLADFEYDLKNGNVSGLKDLSIRNIATSENIPPSFRNHLELVMTEKVIGTTKTRMVQCLPCRAKKTTLNQDQMIISSNELNPSELARISKSLGIENFMDVAFSYQPTGMMLSATISDAESGNVVWSRSYNSETSRASAYRRGVDLAQVDQSIKSNEYIPAIQYRAAVYYFSQPDIGERSGVLGLGFRMVERYDNRRKEVGFETNYMFDTGALTGANQQRTGSSVATDVKVFSSFNLTLLFIHAWNLIGHEENYNRVRGTIFTGIGGTYASGFLGALMRTGYEWRLAKHWAVNVTLGYRPKSTTILSGSHETVSGLEYGFGVSALF